MTHLVRSANESLAGDAVLNLLGFVAGALESATVHEKAMKASIWGLFTELNKIMSGDGARNWQARMAFFAAYQSQLRKVAAQMPNMVGLCQNRNNNVDQGKCWRQRILWYVCQIVMKDRRGSDPCQNALVSLL